VFEVDKANEAVFDAVFSHLCLRLVQIDARDQLGRNLSLKKGFLLMGDLGSGKSTLMRLISEFVQLGQYLKKNGAVAFKPTTTQDVCQLYKQTGSIDKHTYNEDGVTEKPAVFCFDELGREPRVVDHYGTKLDVMSQVLQIRYALWQTKGVYSHFITNMNLEELTSTYGEFIVQRIVEMSNVIELNGDSRRL